MTVETKTNIEDLVTYGYADNAGIKIHYASLGSGPFVLFLHGFPDFWYTWRQQLPALSQDCQTVAIDLRGYNLSDKPEGSENYQMKALISDVHAVLRHFGQRSATIVGHDWGGAIAWATAIYLPRLVERLIVLNSLHPLAMLRALATDPAQRKASEYAKLFKLSGAHRKVKVDDLLKWVTDPEAKAKYTEAFNHTSIEAALSYYQNYPDEPFDREEPQLPRIKCPVLQIFGLKDEYILPSGLRGTWELIDNEYTLVTIPGAGHFVQQDAAETVTSHIGNWLKAKR